MMDSTDRTSLFEAYLHQHDDRAWLEAVDRLSSTIHEVDRRATEIWFRFFPLAIARALQSTADRAELTRKLWLQGQPDLAAHIDTSHRFLYGHRYWPQVKATVLARMASGGAPLTLDMATLVRDIAADAVPRAGVDVSLVMGITAVALKTVQHVGAAAFAASPGSVTLTGPLARMSPDALVAARNKDDSQGMFGFLKGERREYTVRFDETDEAATFKLINTQELTTAAQYDLRDYRSRDSRCHEGPIPVQCRSAACGTCWVGILGGNERLAPVTAFERKQIREFGYLQSDDPRPIIRLACQTPATGNVTIVIPPWNGIFGKYFQQAVPPAPHAPGAVK